MKRSTHRILTTHTGSLVRPPQLREFARARQANEAVDEQAYNRCLEESVSEVVHRQVQAGIDIINDGEFGKSTSWSLYALRRLSGFELRPIKAREDNPFEKGADRQRFKDFYLELDGGADGRTWSNVNPPRCSLCGSDK